MIALLALCLQLGFWQLERAEQKRQVTEAGQQETRIDAAAREPTKALWKSTSVAGRYSDEVPYLLDSQTHQGQAGYQVFSRFVTEDHKLLLINRGWINKNTVTSLKRIEPQDQLQTIRGIVAPYRRAGMRLGPAVISPPNATPVVVNYPTQQEWEALFEQALLPFTIWLAADQPNGYLRDWQVQSVPPEKHLGYAFQWFAMATAVAVIGLILLLRILRHDD